MRWSWKGDWNWKICLHLHLLGILNRCWGKVGGGAGVSWACVGHLPVLAGCHSTTLQPPPGRSSLKDIQKTVRNHSRCLSTVLIYYSWVTCCYTGHCPCFEAFFSNVVFDCGDYCCDSKLAVRVLGWAVAAGLPNQTWVSLPHSLGRPLLPGHQPLATIPEWITPMVRLETLVKTKRRPCSVRYEEKRGNGKLVRFESWIAGLSCAGTRLEQIWDNKHGVTKLRAERLNTECSVFSSMLKSVEFLKYQNHIL